MYSGFRDLGFGFRTQSRLRVALLAVAGLAGLLSTWCVIGASPAAAAPPLTAAGAVVSCVAYTTSTPYVGLGYNHLVHLTNNCDKAVVCNVTTNVNKQGIGASLAPAEKKTVVTWQGSPASEFTADVECRAR